MEASSPRQKIGSKSLGDVLSTRGGAIAVAAVAAILAGILLFVFVQRYRDNSNVANSPTPVFVARAMIPQGTSADLIASQQLVQRTTVKNSQVQAGAIADPGVLHGQVALGNIYPGQQLTRAEFTLQATISSDLTGDQRAVAVPVDAAHGLVGFLRAGDHVDVLASYSGGGGNHNLSTLLQDIYVLSAPAAGGGGINGGGNASNIVLRIPTQAAGQVAYAADNGKVWMILRPPPPATQSSSTGSGAAPTGTAQTGAAQTSTAPPATGAH
jgi:pilus assembly protein CpaB